MTTISFDISEKDLFSLFLTWPGGETRHYSYTRHAAAADTSSKEEQWAARFTMRDGATERESRLFLLWYVCLYERGVFSAFFLFPACCTKRFGLSGPPPTGTLEISWTRAREPKQNPTPSLILEHEALPAERPFSSCNIFSKISFDSSFLLRAKHASKAIIDYYTS